MSALTGGLVRIAAIAGNTMREAIRNRVLYTLLAFAVLMIAAGIVIANLSYVESDEILQSLGLSAMRLFGVIISISVGVGLIHREVERRTVYTILSKPISRSEFLIGKYLGLVATIWTLVGIMAAAFVGACLVGGAELGWTHAAAIGLVGAELCIVVAVATLFSAFSTPMLSALFTSGIYVAGVLSRDLVALGAQTEVSSIIQTTRVVHWLLPDLDRFDLTLHAVHGLPLAPDAISLPLIHAAGYVTVLLLLATIIFERRDFR